MQSSPYLQCGHCRCEFLGSQRQRKRARAGKTVQYCSRVCQDAGESARKTKGGHRTICLHCGKEFTSRATGRKYCTMQCYTTSPEFQARVRAQTSVALQASVLKATGAEQKPKVEVTCLHCGAKRIIKPSLVAQAKYCSRRCYRAYMAERFDRWIAAPQNIALPQGYDEFLSQNELPCLIEGCNWTGRHLGNHVNFAHGIPVEEFKRAAGFNKTTGLCTPAVSDTLANRPHLQDKEALKAAFLENVSTENSIPPVVRNYRSLEGREHRVKAISLLSCGPPKEVELVCIACGSEFHPGPLTVNAKYCSIECRNKWYKENRKRAWLTCFGCGKDFEGSRQQELGFERGRPVFCGMKCRGRHNIKAALGMRGLSLRS